MSNSKRSIIPEDWTPIHPSAIKKPQSYEKSRGIPLYIPVPPMAEPPTHRPRREEDHDINFDITTTYNL